MHQRRRSAKVLAWAVPQFRAWLPNCPTTRVNRHTTTWALALALALTGCVQPSMRFSDEDEAAVRAVLEAQRQAWNAGDLDAYMAGYERSDRLVFTSGGQIRRGWETTRAKYLARYGDSPQSMGHLDFDIDEVRGVGDGAAVVLGHWRLTETPQAGGGVFSLVMARSPDGWHVIHDHTSAGT